jgi:4-hydroxythreonine-4-phosphate dehydrogenase
MALANAQGPLPRIAITPGEPAGIGPDVVLMAAQKSWDAELVCIADRDLLAQRAGQLSLNIELLPFTTGDAPQAHRPGQLRYIHVPAPAPITPGELQVENAYYVLATLSLATELCRCGDAQAMVTGPVQKSVINDAGIPFTGHTEFLAQAFNCPKVVMMLAAGNLRVALATTHLPLAAVPAAITQEHLEETLRILHNDLQQNFGLNNPRITVLGLNPHAGEGGHLGREEIEIMAPVIERLLAEGFKLSGPIPADTAFNSDWRGNTDAYLAMYHDQGLPVLKFAGFGEAVNITLGLPALRTSVDHGTALDLAGTGRAQSSSLEAAIAVALGAIPLHTQG